MPSFELWQARAVSPDSRERCTVSRLRAQVCVCQLCIVASIGGEVEFFDERRGAWVRWPFSCQPCHYVAAM